jgi:hypothetical protein
MNCAVQMHSAPLPGAGLSGDEKGSELGFHELMRGGRKETGSLIEVFKCEYKENSLVPEPCPQFLVYGAESTTS